MKHGKSIMWGLVALLCLCVILYASCNIFMQYQEYKAAVDEYDELTEIAYQNAKGGAAPDTDEQDANAANGRGDVPPYESPIDFETLREINPAIVGWIVVEGTSINYPILQGEDNSHYLNFTYTGAANSSGAIFMDYRNAASFTAQNTIIYGHKMNNATMFHDLSEYKSQTFYEAHPAFTIFTPDQEYRCEVFAAYVTSPISETYVLDFDDKASFVQYLNIAIDRSVIQTGTVLYSTDRIVTLSTCDYTFDDARMVVHAVLHEG